jgi:hypothetical protein
MHDLRPPLSKNDEGRRRERLTRSAYFLGAVLFHLILFLILATWVIFRAPPVPPPAEFSAVKVKIAPPPPPPQPSSDGGASSPTEPTPVAVPPPMAPSVAHVTAQTSFRMESTKALNDAITHASTLTGGALDPGKGPGHGPGKGGLFNNGDGTVGLVGTLYDLKQTQDHQPTSMAEVGEEHNNTGAFGGWEQWPGTIESIKVLSHFVKNWNTDDLDKYFHPTVTLSAVQIFIPKIVSELAPKAFQVDGIVRPRRWVVVYKGTITPPRDGTFRFIGRGDDFLVVRIDGNNVLDASYPSEQLDPSANTAEDVGRGADYLHQSLVCGKWFKVHQNEPVGMEVLIGEGPGGDSSMFLFIDDMDNPSPKGNYPVFQMQDVPLPKADDPSFVPPAFTGKKFLFAPSM